MAELEPIEKVVRECVLEIIQRGGEQTEAKIAFGRAVENYFTHGSAAYHDAEILKAAHKKFQESKV